MSADATRSGRRTTGNQGAYRGRTLVALASTASERRCDVVQRSHQANLLLPRQLVNVRPAAGSRAPTNPPRDDPWRSVGGQLVPGAAERLQRVLERGQGVRRGGVGSGPPGGGVEVPGGVGQLGRALIETMGSVHAWHRRAGAGSPVWASMPNGDPRSLHSSARPGMCLFTHSLARLGRDDQTRGVAEHAAVR